jgi:diacylglycerol kinase family enzyme
MIKAIVIVNKGGGSFSALPKHTQSAYLKKLFQENGVDAEIFIVKGKKILETAENASKKNVDIIVAGGGDGTISTVASKLINKDIPLGVLPLGTLNHFARDLEIPLDLESAIKVIGKKYVVNCDVGQVNNLIFLNNSSIGLYPQLVKKRDLEREKLGLGKWPAMMLAVLSSIFRIPVLQVALEIDGKLLKSKSPFIFVGNNHYNMDLLNLGSREHLDKGELCLYLANRITRFGLLHLLFLALLGRLNQTKDFRIETAKEIWIETKKRKLKVALDGEVQKLRPPLHYLTLHKSLKVVVPCPTLDRDEL